jgi:hypothetical protein
MLVLDIEREPEPRLDVPLSANSVHALLGHGVVEALNALPLEGRIGGGLDALLPPSSLDAARRILYEADRTTYGGSFEFVVESGEQENENEPVEPLEHRIRIDNREYQVSLARLQFLCTQASRGGMAVWIRI